MVNYTAIILCLAYIIGLFSVSLFLPSFTNVGLNYYLVLIGCLGLTSAVISLVIPRIWRNSPSKKVWLFAGLIAILAVFYFQIRLPKIDSISIDKLKPKSGIMVEVQGTIINEPRLTRKQRVKCILAAQKIDEIQEKNLKLYVTVPLLQGTGLYPGEKLSIKGIFYQPKFKTNPGGFDFKSYLAREGIFWGLSGREVEISTDNIEPFLSLHKLRQKIVRSQIQWLGSPLGQLVTSMVLGSRAVDLPGDIQDSFNKTGLAHALAASGFQVSLLLGVVVFFTRNSSPKIQFIIGLTILLLYLALTGIEASVMRAVVMGIGALFGLVTERKVKIFSTLLLSAVILLIINPLWLMDLGFQLSFLATLGLIATVPSIEKKLDWLPPTIAGLISVPLAASIWTLPLTSYVFNTVALYSIFVNIITTPLIAVVSLGGMLSALAALIYPLLGSFLAWLLYYPTCLLLTIVDFFANLPGSSLSIGKISLLVLLIIYLGYGLALFNRWWQVHWIFLVLFIITIVIVPIWYHQSKLVQITVLAYGREPIIVIQNKGKVALVGGGESETLDYVVLPFLRQQGINNLDCAIALNFEQQEFWSNLAAAIPVGQIYSIFATENYINLTLNQKIEVGDTLISLVSDQPSVLKLDFLKYNWLLLANEEEKFSLSSEENTGKQNYQSQVFLWSGKNVNPEWLEVVKPEVAIVFGNSLNTKLQEQLDRQKIELYWTGRDGGIQWTLDKGFETTLEEDTSPG